LIFGRQFEEFGSEVDFLFCLIVKFINFVIVFLTLAVH
jgi:hypothetical protein